jgi:hypothetical protein
MTPEDARRCALGRWQRPALSMRETRLQAARASPPLGALGLGRQPNRRRRVTRSCRLALGSDAASGQPARNPERKTPTSRIQDR